MKNELVNLANDCQQIDLKKANKEIVELYKEVSMIGRKMALKIFKIGELIFNTQMHLTPEEAREWIKTGLPFSEKTAKNYMKVYLHFYERQDQLKELTIMQAYAVAGISGRNELPAPKEEDEEVLFLQEGETVYTASADDTSENNEDIKALFKKPTLSGCNLKVHRTVFSGLKLWCYTRNTKQPTLLCDLLILPLPALDKDFQELRDTVQIQFEKYLMKLEELK
ncbi:MAG: hypothetical protein P1P59_04255 [Treponemataceae bacterium]